ncbi:peptide deformylase [Streptomyces wedmorensis]|uniref:peptide deformylase n=1 Tax=Streptomyces wedmorensis TaxID=43759 RepID=UPI003798578C
MNQVRPSEQMRGLGVVQHGAPVLAESARASALPAERDAVERVVEQLFSAMERIGQMHPFAKGMGLAAPQIAIARAAAVVQPPDSVALAIVLLNPRITGRSDVEDEQFEGCLSFFDVCGLVPRSLRVAVETATPEGQVLTTTYDRGLPR